MERQKICGKSGVYAIIFDGVIRYIGSSVNIESRKSNHLANLRKGIHKNKKLQKIYDELGEEHLAFYVLDYCDTESLYILENYHIQIHKDTIVNRGRVIKTDKYVRDEKESRQFREKMSKIMRGEGNPNAQLTEKEAIKIIEMKNKGVEYKDIADKFNIRESYVADIGRIRWRYLAE